MRFGTRSGECFGVPFVTGETENGVPVREQLLDDGGADETCGTCNEDAHCGRWGLKAGYTRDVEGTSGTLALVVRLLLSAD